MSTQVAGRALDAEVAEKVMGCVEGNAPVGDRLSRRTGTFEAATMADLDAKIKAAYPKSLARGQLWDAIYTGPAYSTTWEGAGQVVEKMWERLPQKGLGTYRFELSRRDSDGWYVCEFAPDPEGDFRTHARAEADTAPLAICLAAISTLDGAL